MGATKKPSRNRKQASKEAEALGRAFGKATKAARIRAFKVSNTVLVERDGWLVRVNKSGKVLKRVKQLAPVILPPTN
jgi:hypothetical protein